MQHIHILGICGTFMGSLAQLAVQAGFKVTGCDTAVYPPMSTQLEQAGIHLIEGFNPDQIALKPDVFIVGNVISRGNPLMEAILDQGLRYQSGPQWLAENILQGRWVLGVAGTHGKTTTSSLLTWILEYAGFKPGYLIGGVPENFGRSASLGESDFFVIEADEYDTAFFDKRSKFVHYQIRTLILNNLEFDHADIFADLAAIQQQFHHLLRTIPANGLAILPAQNKALAQVLEQGCWTEQQFSAALDCTRSTANNEPLAGNCKNSNDADWQFSISDAHKNSFDVVFRGQCVGHVDWSVSGVHNIENALHAIAAARHIGILPELACAALADFVGVKRRMECVGEVANITIYDDFAHHPTAIATTLDGLRKKVGSAPIVAIIEPRSNTMKMGVHRDKLLEASALADQVFWFEQKGMDWSLADYVCRPDASAEVMTDTDQLLVSAVDSCIAHAAAHGQVHVVVMSNGGFDGMPIKLFEALQGIA